jgi:hypothetical protein
LESYSFVQTKNSAIVQTIEPSVDLNYSAHDFRCNSAHHRACSIVKVSLAKVITIEPSADALSVEEVVRLFSGAFGQTCALKEVGKLVLERFRVIS